MDSQMLLFSVAAATLGVTMLIWQTHRFIRSMRISTLSEDWLARRRCRPDFNSQS